MKWLQAVKLNHRGGAISSLRRTLRILSQIDQQGDECMNRRTLLTTAFVGATASILSSELKAQAPAAGGWPIKPLPFDPKKLKGLSEKLIVSHHDNNYAGAARRIGQIQQMLSG